MYEDIKTIKNELLNKKNAFMLLVIFLFGIMVFLPLIANNLNNQYDSLWVGPYFYANKNEYECGRWLWPLVDKVLQGYNGEPFVTVFSVLVFSLGIIVLINALNIKDSISKYVLGFSILSTSTMCNQLTFKHQSYMFALSFLFAVFSAYILLKCKNKIVSIAFSSIFLILTLASYQSEIGCFCLIIISFLVINIFHFDIKEIIEIVLKAIITIVVSCALYKFIWDVFLNLKGFSITDYRGASSLSLINMLVGLPNNTYKAYLYFIDYYTGSLKFVSYPFIIKILIAYLLLIVVLIILKNKDFIKSVLFVVMILLVPIACNFTCLFLDAGISPQQTLPAAILLPLLLTLTAHINITFSRITKPFTYCLQLLFLVGALLTTLVDIEAMKEGKIATESLLSNVTNTLIESGYYNSNDKYYLFGEPCKNEMFYVTELWNVANDYAKIGTFGNSGFATPADYQAFYSYYLGTNLQCYFSSNNDYINLMDSTELAEMSCYPYEGSIKEINDYIVIKISN